MALYTFNTSLTLSNADYYPPHITTNLASLAPTSPPLTGASIESIPFSNADLYILYANSGDDVVWSIKIEPFFICLRMPSSPNTTDSTSVG